VLLTSRDVSDYGSFTKKTKRRKVMSTDLHRFCSFCIQTVDPEVTLEPGMSYIFRFILCCVKSMGFWDFQKF